MKPYYERAGITIYHGDCRDVLQGLRGVADICLTDPPFSVPVKYHDADGDYPRSWGDLVVMEPFFADVLKGIRQAVKDTGQTYVCCDADSYPVFYKAAMPCWPQSKLIVWYKATGRRGRGWMHSHELVLHLRTTHTQYTDAFQQDVIGIMPVRTLNRRHPAEKPIDLWEFLANAIPKRPFTVIDPFMGSGSVLKMAQRLGVRAIGIDCEERWCEEAVNGLSQELLPLVHGGCG